jgi:hypothetical protein
MMKGVKIVTSLLLSVLLLACRKEETGKDLTIIFATTTGLVSDGYNELIINAVMEGVSAQPNVTVHLLKPDNIAEARSQFNEWLAGADDNKALILCGPEFESLVQGTTLEKGRILLLDSDKTYGEDISTALLKRYGGAWLAGALTKDFKMLLIKGLDGDRIIDIISQGFEDGYKENGGAGFRKYVLSTGYEGLNMPDELCSLMWDRDELDLYDLRSLEELVVPVCGSSSLGAFSFCRTWYYGAVGVGDDCAPYSDTVPFSLILDLGGIVKEYFTAWVQDSPWPAHADFGMNTGHVRISFNERFYSHILGKQEGWPLSLAAWQALENQYKDQAFEKEADHAY